MSTCVLVPVFSEWTRIHDFENLDLKLMAFYRSCQELFKATRHFKPIESVGSWESDYGDTGQGHGNFKSKHSPLARNGVSQGGVEP